LLITRLLGLSNSIQGFVTKIFSRFQNAEKPDSDEIEPSPEAPSEGDLARQALLALSDVPECQGSLSALVDGPRSESFSLDPVVTTAVVAAALVVLQTHVRIERDKKGKISVLNKKKPTRDALLKPLVRKLLSFIPSGPYDGACVNRRGILMVLFKKQAIHHPPIPMKGCIVRQFWKVRPWRSVLMRSTRMQKKPNIRADSG